jgi:hypothetical protein
MSRLALPVLLLVACSEAPTLLIRVEHPTTFDPAVAQGTLTVELLDANTSSVEQGTQVKTVSLEQQQRLFEELGLVEGRIYQVRLRASFDGKATCSDSGYRAVGVSPVFSYDRGLGELSVYMDCADKASPTGPPVRPRIYHAAALLPRPEPHGQVLLLGGAKPELDLDPATDTLTLYDSVERYDPASGRFTELEARVSRASAWHQATTISEEEVVVTGGYALDEIGGKKVALSLSRSEQVTAQGRVAALPALKQGRGAHGAAVTSRGLLLAGGLSGAFILPLKTLELIDPSGQSKPPALPQMNVARYLPVVVPFDRDRQVLIAGGHWVKDQEAFADLLCLEGDCGCGAPPCIQAVPGFGVDGGRYGLSSAFVPCPTSGGAIYVVGGSHTELLTKKETTFDEIYCLDTAAPIEGLKLAGKLKKPRTGHTTTLVRGPSGGHRLFVAGGAHDDKPDGSTALATSGELVPVDCSCQVTGTITEVDLSFRVGHTATLLPDGTVLLVGGFTDQKAERFNPGIW